MKKLTFENKEIADLFADCTKVTGSTEKQADGTVVFAYDTCCDKEPEVAKADQAYEIFEKVSNYWRSEFDYIHRRIDRIGEAFAKHSKGHLPSAKSASQMESALKGLGWDNEYEVKKGQIRVEDDGHMIEACW